MNLFWGS